MERRLFIKKLCGGMLLLASPSTLFADNIKSGIRFGMVTDLHYSGREAYGTRYFSQSKDKLRDAIRVFNDEKVDFIIELGDFKDQDAEPEREKTLSYLDEIEEIYQTFSGPTYHVLGNHDMDSISKDDFLKHTTNHGNANKKSYYSFQFDGVKFIVLDANYNENGSDYDSGNFDWTKAYIPDAQKKWLSAELKDNLPTIVFIHQMLDSFSGISQSLCVANAAEIVSILEGSGNVAAVFQGHHHPGTLQLPQRHTLLHSQRTD